MKIAIVGSGISGLVAAHLLHPRHEICVYEAADRIGGHTHTVDVSYEGERHCYVLRADQSDGLDTSISVRTQKEFHVSPCMPMEHSYSSQFCEPDRRIEMNITNFDRSDEPIFAAGLKLQRKEISGRTLARAIRRGLLTFVEDGWHESFGDPDASLQAKVYIEDPRFYRSLAFRGALGGAEAYMNGYWQTHDLTAVIRILALNQDLVQGSQRGFASAIRPAFALFHAMHSNTRSGSRHNVAAHYDLGNEFFEKPEVRREPIFGRL